MTLRKHQNNKNIILPNSEKLTKIGDENLIHTSSLVCVSHDNLSMIISSEPIYKSNMELPDQIAYYINQIRLHLGNTQSLYDSISSYFNLLSITESYNSYGLYGPYTLYNINDDDDEFINDDDEYINDDEYTSI